MRHASGFAVTEEKRANAHTAPFCCPDICEETGERWFRAGEYAAPGTYIEIETRRSVTLLAPDFLPARLDGQAACYRLTRRGADIPQEPALAWKQAQFQIFAARTQKRLFLFARRVLNNTQDAEDITQETFARAWGHFDSFDPQRPFEAWVFRIARNLMIDLSRCKGPGRMLSLDAPAANAEGGEGNEGACLLEIPDSAGDPACCLMTQEISDDLQSALGSLPPVYRMTLLLLAQQHSYQQIARACDCSVGTVRSRAHRARVLMRRSLKEDTLHD